MFKKLSALLDSERQWLRLGSLETELETGIHVSMI